MIKLFATLSLAICVLTSALAELSDVNPLISQMLEVTGLAKEIQGIPKQLRAVIARDPRIQNLTPEQRATFQSLVLRAYAPPAILEVINRTLQQNYDEASFKQFIQLYQQPLARKIHALEDEAETPEWDKNKQAYLSEMPSHPATQERLSILKNLDHATHDSAGTVNLQIAISRSMAGAAAMEQPKELRPSPEQLKKSLADLSAQMRASLEPAVTLNTQQSYLYVYRDVSDAELKEYIESYENPAIQLSMNLIEVGLFTAIEEASAKVIHDINEAKANILEHKI